MFSDRKVSSAALGFRISSQRGLNIYGGVCMRGENKDVSGKCIRAFIPRARVGLCGACCANYLGRDDGASNWSRFWGICYVC